MKAAVLFGAMAVLFGAAGVVFARAGDGWTAGVCIGVALMNACVAGVFLGMRVSEVEREMEEGQR